MGLFRRYKQRRAQKEEAERQALDEEEAILQNGVEVRKQIMLKSPCAVNAMENCKAECVHFCNGYVLRLPDLHGGMYFATENPRCRLWGDR